MTAPPPLHKGYLLLAVLWAMAVLAVNSIPASGLPEVTLPIPHADKFAHAGMYGVMACLLCLAGRPNAGGGPGAVRSPALFGFLFAALVGLLDEIHQLRVAGRAADALDWLADVAGALVAVLVMLEWRERRRDSRCQGRALPGRSRR